MSIMSALFNNKASSFQEVFNCKDITSPPMKEAIGRWFDMYFDNEPTTVADPCQRVPYTIINKLTKTTFSEYEASVTTKGKKSDFMTCALDALGLIKKEAFQQCLIGGTAFIKPILYGNGFIFRVVSRAAVLILARDECGNVTSIGTTERVTENGTYYTLLERRTVDVKGMLRIESRLYASQSTDTLGVPVSLASLPRYENLVPEVVLPKPVGNIGLVAISTPMENCVDGSDDGVAVYAPAEGLITNININERQINTEFNNGESRIVVSSDLLATERDANGNVKNRRLTDNIFVGVDDNPENVGVTIFSPTLRGQSFFERKNEYLRACENIIGLKRGILSDVNIAEKSATEILSTDGDYNLTITDFQAVWDTAVREALRTVDALGQNYKLCDASKFNPLDDVSIDWGDGVLFDRERTWTEYKEMVADGLIKPEIAIAWYFGLPFPEDEKALEDIRARYMPEMEDLTEKQNAEVKDGEDEPVVEDDADDPEEDKGGA